MDPGYDDLPSDDPADGSPESLAGGSIRGENDGVPEDAEEGAEEFGDDAQAFDEGDESASDDRLDDGAQADGDAEPARTPGERWLQRASPLVLPALLTVGILVLIVKARATLEQSPRFLVDPSVVAVMTRPAWISNPVASQIALAVATGLGRQASLLDGQQLQAWADALTDPNSEISPWIESVERLEPHFPHQVDVRIRVARPVLILDGGVLVTAKGKVLGPGPVAISPAPLIYLGQERDEDLLECAAAAGELSPFRAELERLGVRVVGVATGADETVTFTTDSDVLISWGRSARKSPWSHLDLPPSERLGNLRQVLVDYPGLVGLGFVQLWTDRPVSVRRDR